MRKILQTPIDEELAWQLKIQAAKERRTLIAMTVDALTEYLEKQAHVDKLVRNGRRGK